MLHQVEVLLERLPGSLLGRRSDFVIEDMTHEHGVMPSLIMGKPMPRKATIMVDLSHRVLVVELVDRPQLTTPPVGEKKRTSSQ